MATYPKTGFDSLPDEGAEALRKLKTRRSESERIELEFAIDNAAWAAQVLDRKTGRLSCPGGEVVAPAKRCPGGHKIIFDSRFLVGLTPDESKNLPTQLRRLAAKSQKVVNSLLWALANGQSSNTPGQGSSFLVAHRTLPDALRDFARRFEATRTTGTRHLRRELTKWLDRLVHLTLPRETSLLNLALEGRYWAMASKAGLEPSDFRFGVDRLRKRRSLQRPERANDFGESTKPKRHG